MRTFKALSANALLPNYRIVMMEARIVSVIVSWWKFFGYLVLNRVAEIVDMHPNYINQSLISFALKRTPLRPFQQRTRNLDGFQPVMDIWDANFRPLVNQLLQDHPELAPIFTNELSHVIDDQIIQYQARQMKSAIHRHLAENIFQYSKQMIQKQLREFGFSWEDLGVLVDDIMFTLCLMPRIAEGPLPEGVLPYTIRSPYFNHPLVQSVLNFHLPTFELLKYGYELYRQYRRPEQEQQQPLNPRRNRIFIHVTAQRRLTPKKMMVLLKKDSIEPGPAVVISVIINHFKHIQSYMREVNGKILTLLPRSGHRPGYVHLDGRCVDRILQTNGTNVNDMINYRHFGLRGMRADALRRQPCSISTDGYSISVTFGRERGEEVNEMDDDEDDGGRIVDVSRMPRGLVRMEQTRHLQQRIGRSKLIGLDPGVISIGTAVDEQVERSFTEEEAIRVANSSSRTISNGHYSHLMHLATYQTCTQFEKEQDGIIDVETELSTAQSLDQYIQIVLNQFPAIFQHYSRPLHRKWRSRLFSLKKSALDKCAQYLADVVPTLPGDAPSKPPILPRNDADRKQAKMDYK